MRIFYNLKDFLKSKRPLRKTIVTIGVFDGVHRAHQKIVRRVVRKARARGQSSVLITFYPHPANILNPSKKVPQLISLDHRLRLLKELGLDCVIVLRFTKKLSRMAPPAFIVKVLGKLHASEVVVGSNFFFGRGKNGSLDDLERFSREYGYKVSRINILKIAGKAVSSTWIRSLILRGELKKASKFLLRPVSVLGTVVKGRKKGRIIGYPTANIDPHHEAVPPSGVYAVKIKLKTKTYNGLLNIGTRPTFSDEGRDPTIEAHILGFKKSIYGEDIEVMFVRKIRQEKRFKDVRGLRSQIKRDEAHAKKIL